MRFVPQHILIMANLAKPQCNGSPTCGLSAEDFEESNRDAWYHMADYVLRLVLR